MSQQQRAGTIKDGGQRTDAPAETETQAAADMTMALEEARKEAAELRARLEAEEAARKQAETEAKELSDRVDSDVSRVEEAVKRQLRAQRKVRIVIPSGKSEHERAPVPVAVNGREFLIVRDCEVDVPEAVCGVLDLAVERIPAVEGEGAMRRTVFKEAPAYPYRRVGAIDPETGDLVQGA